jgi:pyrimidine-nucleoside phosphorylase
MDAEFVGRAAVVLGAGRDRVDADVDPAAGIDVAAPVGTRVGAGEAVFTLMTSDRARLDAARRLLDEAVDIGDRAPATRPPVLETIDGRTVSV